jgi:VWFA-related protein
MRCGWISVAVIMSCIRLVAQDQSTYTIRVNSDLMQVRVVVRDRDGRFIPDLTKDDFRLQEDGRIQQLSAVDWETVGTTSEVPAQRLPSQLRVLTSNVPLPAAAARGLRLVVLFFDFTSLDLADAARALRAAEDYINTISGADRVAVVSLAPKLEVQQDFTGDKAQLLEALKRLHGFSQMVLQTVDDPSYELFYRYGRLESLRVLTTTLARVAQKKSVVIFAGKVPFDDLDLVSITTTVDDAVRAGVSFYGVDATGLTATPPLGDASVAASYGTDVLSGKAAVQASGAMQRDQLLYDLAHGTGGRAFFDSNDFERPFRTLENDTSEYYILSYRSSNSQRDGRYRRISLNVSRPRVELKYQAGYYAPRTDSPVVARDAERILSEQLAADLPATSLPVFGFVNHLHIRKDLFYIPITVLLPSEALLHNGAASSALIGLAVIDHRGHRVRKLRDVVSPALVRQHPRRAVQYQTGTQLPAGEYTVRIVVVQNGTGQVGSFSTALRLSQQNESPLEVSSVLSGSLEACSDSSSPLAFQGLCLQINPLREYGAGQDFAMQYQVDCGAVNEKTTCDAKQTRSSLQCFFSDQRAFNVEPPATAVRGDTAVFRVDVPPGIFHPGMYQCRVTAINPQLGAFAFGAAQIRVRDELRSPSSPSGGSGP